MNDNPGNRGFTDYKEILQAMQPKPAEWFAPDVEYEGEGHACYAEREIRVGGIAKASFHDDGKGLICIPGGHVELPPGEHQESVFAWLDGTWQVVELADEHGSLVSENIICTRSSSTAGDNRLSIQFQPLECRYECKGDDVGTPEYWVLPLTNFVSDFVDRDAHLDDHPLRIYPTPAIPGGLPDHLRTIASMRANQMNKLIVFRFAGDMAFIERLPDYEERVKALEEDSVRAKVTSIMVGKIPRGALMRDWREWPIRDLLNVLSLATGRGVGAKWIEFRDSRRCLVGRIHRRMDSYLSSTEGIRVVHEGSHRGTGLLLSSALSSKEFGKPYLRAVIKYLVFSGIHGIPIENRLDHIFRALDCLCQHHGLTSNTSMRKIIGRSQAAPIQAILNEAEAKIKEEICRGKGIDPEIETALIKVAKNIHDSALIRRAFGRNVQDLLDRYSLPDAHIIESYYEKCPRPDGRAWSSVLSCYRGTIMHQGFFDFDQSNLDRTDTYRIADHLHDILIRIIFQILSYKGNYQPVMHKVVDIFKSDWANKDTSAKDLGYSE